MLIQQSILEPFGVTGIPFISIPAPERDDAMLLDLFDACHTITNFINRHRHDKEADEKSESFGNHLDSILRSTMIKHGVKNPHSHTQRLVIPRNRWIGMSYAFTYTLRNGKTFTKIIDLPFRN